MLTGVLSCINFDGTTKTDLPKKKKKKKKEQTNDTKIMLGYTNVYKTKK